MLRVADGTIVIFVDLARKRYILGYIHRLLRRENCTQETLNRLRSLVNAPLYRGMNHKRQGTQASSLSGQCKLFEGRKHLCTGI